MPKNKPNPDVKQTVAWRIKPEVMKLLEEAQRITGSDRTEIIEACIVAAVDEVTDRDVERKAEEAKRAVAENEKRKKRQQQS